MGRDLRYFDSDKILVIPNICKYKSSFVDVINSKHKIVRYRINYCNENDYQLVEYVIHRLGQNNDKMYWAKNRGLGMYTTDIMMDVKSVDTLRHKYNGKYFNFNRYFKDIVQYLESINQEE